MKSLDEVKKILPERALSLFQEIYGPARFDKLLHVFRTKRVTSFRINTLKADMSSIHRTLTSLPFKITSYPHLSNVFTCQPADQKLLEKTSLYKTGKIYLQSISSMIPAYALDPQADEIICDVAAAPGSKTSLMAEIMQNRGTIHAIEPDSIRFQRLEYNLKLLGVENTTLHLCRGETFLSEANQVFHRILVDAPCSGEGRFSIFDKKSYGRWKINEIKKYAGLQRTLLSHAVEKVTVGGRILYSTCTINPYENEEVVSTILERYPEMESVPFPPLLGRIPEAISPLKSFRSRTYHPGVSAGLRIFPSTMHEGFYMALLKKKK